MRRLLPRAATFALVILAIVIVALSPFVLDDFGGKASSWTRRADIGQTYGAAAALLAVLALAGVAISLVLQARETKVNREHASRQVHTELIRMALDDPAYVECWGPYVDQENPVSTRQHGYVNLILSYWESRFELGTFTEQHLRSGAREMFSSPPGRRFWSTTRIGRSQIHETRRQRRFHEIVDGEYLRAVERTPVLRERPMSRPESRRRMRRNTAVAGSVVGLGIAGWALGRRRRR